MIYYYIELINQGISGKGLILRMARTALFYPRGAMWFVLSCIVSSAILQFAINCKISRIKVTIVSLLLYTFALVGNTYYFLVCGSLIQKIVDIYRYIFYSVRNGVFLFVFFWMGYLLSCSDIKKLLEKRKSKLCFAFGVSYICLIFEVCICYSKQTVDDNSLFFAFPVLLPLLLYFATEIRLSDHKIYRQMRSFSSFAYFVHPFLTVSMSMFFDFEIGVKFYFAVILILFMAYGLLGIINNDIINKFI